MKFGKRLAAEASRRWRPFYLDYKALKRALARDVTNHDTNGTAFALVLKQELKKISAFYVEKEEELQAIMQGLTTKPPAALISFHSEVQDLKKYVVLNYVAVIKAIKKRNRHLKEACQPNPATVMRAVDVLSCEYFYTSPVLAALATQAEVLQAQGGSPTAPADVLEQQYQCPICLGVLHTPVVLTCAHRFCWGCLIAHCATVAAAHLPDADEDGDVWVDAAEDIAPTLPSLPSSASSSGGDSANAQPLSHLSSKASRGRKAVAPAALLSEDEGDQGAPTFDCPVCRKAHILDLDALQVDHNLSAYIEELQQRSAHPSPRVVQTTVVEQAAAPAHLVIRSTPQPSAPIPIPNLAAAAPPPPTPVSVLADAEPEPIAEPEPTATGVEKPPFVEEGALLGPDAPCAMDIDSQPPLLPPQAPGHKGKLTVVLDLDGTLISSYTPRRAPALGPGSVGYVVGRGGRLNPQGVFVVERPGLKEFFTRIAAVAEVVLFTAGLEDYAKPIVDQLESRYGRVFSARLYRPATTACEVYPCIKDLSRLGRDLRRTLLVDDTPLAFYRQPNNGIPVFNFRCDPDDRILLEAVVPMLETLSAVPDIRPVLCSKFNMPRWFVMQGLPAVDGVPHKPGSVDPSRRPRKSASDTDLVATVSLTQPSATRPSSPPPCSPLLLCCDFDKTLTDCDAGERLVGELAPELVPMLAALEMPANFIPVTNSVLAEMHRRGVGRDKLLSVLRSMGSEMPPASRAMLRWAAARDVDIRVLSDCNSVFIAHMLASAKVAPYVREVLTNPAMFERTPANGNATHGVHRLVVGPRHDGGLPPHGCPLCPENLCKGAELQRLRAEAEAQGMPYKRVIYCGDGANDLCPALALREQDVLLARRGHALAELVQQRAESADARCVKAKSALWETHVELMALVQQASNAVLQAMQ